VPLLVPVVEPSPAPAATDLPAELPTAFVGRILFLSSRGGSQGLYLVDPDSRDLWRVTQSWPYQVARRRASSAGGLLVSTASRPCGGRTERGEGGDLVLVDPGDPARQCAQVIVSRSGASGVEITAPGALHYDPAISPDGQWVVYVSNVTGNDEIFKIRSDGTENTRLTENVWEWDKHPTWSPDGARIVFWSNREGRNQLYVMNADGSGVRNLSANAFDDADPVWVR
jgi:TolB protein